MVPGTGARSLIRNHPGLRRDALGGLGLQKLAEWLE
jgi:hypothetical protein